MSFCTSFCASIHINARNIKFFQQILNSPCISGADCRFFPKHTSDTLVIFSRLILSMIDHISINDTHFFIIACFLRNQAVHLLKAFFHCSPDFFHFIFCICIARRKHTIIFIRVSCFVNLFPVVYPKNLRMILQDRMVCPINAVISCKGQIKLFFSVSDSIQYFPVYTLFFFCKLLEIIFLMSFICLDNFHLSEFLNLGRFIRKKALSS